MKTRKEILENKTVIRNGESAIVVMRPLKPLCCELFQECSRMGRIVIRDNRLIVAVGIIKQIKRKH